jgi:hypothetical protein
MFRKPLKHRKIFFITFTVSLTGLLPEIIMVGESLKTAVSTAKVI